MPPSRLNIASTLFTPLLSCVDGRLAWQLPCPIASGNGGSTIFSKPKRQPFVGQLGAESRRGYPYGSDIFRHKKFNEKCCRLVKKWAPSTLSVPLRMFAEHGGPAAGRVVPPARLTIDHAREVLKTLFGHDDFRDGQEQVVSKLLEGESCAGIFPTGAGKSICYQLPGTIMARQGLGLTLIVSPLIALMKDQTDALNAAGIACAKLDSTLDAQEVRDIYSQVRVGGISLLYVSPERFNNERFLSALKGVEVALFVVDEAHCISEWGHNFRPDYLRLADFAKAAKAKARLALTATATPKVAVDIANRLDIPPPNVFRTPFYRPMLSLGAMRAPDDTVERAHLLAELLGGESGDGQGDGASVVYVTLQKTAVEVSQMLIAAGFDARPYHAGLPLAQREDTQEWFMTSPDGESRVVVGTIAFGMGLDKKNVRRVYHFNLPRSPEDLAQQVGRAGRDGNRAVCQTLVSGTDLPLLKSLVYGATPSPAAVSGLLRIVFSGKGDEVDFNFYDISQDLDTKDLVLKTLLAHLQIRGLLREVTPYFETADVRLLEAGEVTLQDDAGLDKGNVLREWVQLLKLTQEALRRKRVGSKWATLRADDVGEALGLPKTQIARLLSGMSDAGLIEVGKSGKIRARFKVMRRPSSRKEAQSLARDLCNTALELEAREISRLDTVLEILCKHEGAAVSSGLSAYFGDSSETMTKAVDNERAALPPGSSKSGSLSQLLTPTEVSEAEINELWHGGVLEFLQDGSGANERTIPSDDAFLLARFAAGIKSPRIGKLKLSLHPSFGCCAHCPFPAVLVRAEAAVAALRVHHH